MKKLVIVFAFITAFLFLGSEKAYAQIETFVEITDCPQLISGQDTCNANLYVATNDGNTYSVDADYGIDFRTGDSTTYGISPYLQTPSPYTRKTLTITPNFQLADTFNTTTKNDTGICLTNIEGQIFARARVSVYSGQTVDSLDVGYQNVVNIGAMIGVLRVLNKSDGSPVAGAMVNFDNWDSDPGGHPYYTDGFGQVVGIHRLNCSKPHTITASLGGISESLYLPPSQPDNSPGTICNGQSRYFDILLPVPTPTPGGPTPTP